jgi:hypothetical protein
MHEINIIKQQLNRIINPKLSLSPRPPIKLIQRLPPVTRPMFHKSAQTINLTVKQEPIENKEWIWNDKIKIS